MNMEKPARRVRVEESRMLDIRQLRKKGLRLDIEGAGSFLWGDGTNAKLEVIPPRLVASFPVWTGYAKGHVPVVRDITIASTPCPYGKSRSWLVCPSCGRRCIALAVSRPDYELSCRVCAGLTYQTQSMSKQARIERKVLALVDRLGLNDSKLPPRMRRRTYERLMQKYEELAFGVLATDGD
ncbi:MAG TPA: hypothetical protein VN317_09840 [Candidatus Methanoperedens sp.]|nr:hypothetical protein [Candidatus Methanoperedens sp.]